MARADYRACDVCNGKAFYDANLSYEFEPFDEHSPPIMRYVGEDDPHSSYRLWGLGDWAVLCPACAKTHKTQIVPR